jgi:hypothetical protein
MKHINPKLVLDPSWISKAHKLDLEYYRYLLMGAQQTYLKNLEMGRFDNFYEIAFHYFNLNSVIADKKMYDSGLKRIEPNKNLEGLISQLAEKDGTLGKEIVKVTSTILLDAMKLYLDKQISELEKIHFYFNNSWIHREPRIYLVFKTFEKDEYEVVKINLTSSRNLGCSVSIVTKLIIPELKEREFKNHLLLQKPILKDFDPDRNVMVIGNGVSLDPVNRINLAKDTVLLNRIMNHLHGFDANVMLDLSRQIEKQKSIPVKLRIS